MLSVVKESVEIVNDELWDIRYEILMVNGKFFNDELLMLNAELSVQIRVICGGGEGIGDNF